MRFCLRAPHHLTDRTLHRGHGEGGGDDGAVSLSSSPKQSSLAHRVKTQGKSRDGGVIADQEDHERASWRAWIFVAFRDCGRDRHATVVETPLNM
jgi:hypothetical protein